MSVKSPSTRAQKRLAQARAAKERRQKIFIFVGLAVFALVLVIQGPGMLDLLRGPDIPETAPAPISTETTHPKKLDSKRKLKSLTNTADPFASRALADNDPRPVSVSAPAGTHDPFQLSSGGGSPSDVVSTPKTAPAAAPSPLPKQIVLGTPTPGAVGRHGWIVVIASIQTKVGRAYAERFATRARRNGLGAVSVLNSSTRKPLRSGYFVVYTGPFATLAAVQRSAAHVHAFGFRTAYVREILRY